MIWVQQRFWAFPPAAAWPFHYHLRWQKPKVDGVCDRDGTPLVQRVDDTRTKVFHRLDQYRSETAAVIPYFEKRGLVRRVNANQPPDEVYREVEAAVGKR